MSRLPSALRSLATLFRIFSLQHMRGRKLRTLLTASGIAFGVAVLLGILLINRSVTKSFENTMVTLAAGADLQVSADWAGLDPAVLDEVRRVPGVHHAAPIVEITANAPRLADGLLLVGVDFGRDPRVQRDGSFAGTIRVGDLLLAGGDPRALIATDKFLRQHGLHVDDVVEITTPRGVEPFHVRGVIETEGHASAIAGSWALMPIRALQRAFERSDRLSRIDVMLQPGTAADEMQSRLAAALGPGIQIAPPWMRSRPIERMMQGVQRTLSMLGFVALFAGVCIIYNTMSMSVIERVRELGVLRACGCTRGQVLSVIMLEGAFYGVVGSIVGALLGLAVAHVSLEAVSASISSAYFILVKVDRVAFSIATAGGAVLLGIVTSIAGSFTPALGAARVHPIDAILRRKYRTEATYDVQRAVRIAAAMAGAAGVVALAAAWTRRGFGGSGYVAIALLIGAVAVSSPVLVLLAANASSRVLKHWFGIEGRLAVENTVRHPARTGFTAAAMIIGLAMIVNTSAVVGTVRHALERWIGTIFSGDILVTAHNPFTAGSVSAPLSEDFAQELLAAGGITRASSIRYAKVTYGGYIVSLLAVDGRLPAPHSGAGSPEAYVSKNFAELFAVGPGGSVTLETQRGPVAFHVAGVAEDYNYNWPRGSIIVDRRLYTIYWGDRLVDQIMLDVSPGTSVEALQKRLHAAYAGPYNLTVFSNREFRENFMAIIDQQFSLTYAQLIVTVVVVALAVTNALLISVISRRSELGVLRAVGASRRQSQKIVMIEAGILGLTGVVYGTIVGAIVVWIFLKLVLVREIGWVVGYSLPASSVALTIAVAAAVSLAGTLIPLRHIGRQSVADLVRYHE